MRTNITTLTLTLLLSSFALAQYTTPDTGVNWNLNDLATDSPTTLSVSGAIYTLHEDLTVAESDTLIIDEDITLEIEPGVRITVFGSFSVAAADVLITAVDDQNPYDGFRFEEFSEINIQNTTIEYGGGLQVLTETFTLDNCVVRYNASGTASGAAVTLSRGAAVITNNQFLFNDRPAISSGANQSVSPYIFNNHIEGNNQANDNRPQINLAATMTSDTLRITQNTIIGDRAMEQAGGIAVANLFGNNVFAIIKDNTIADNRYGLTIYGPTDYVLIEGNIIEDNDTQGDPMLGGSGINIQAPTDNMNNVLVTDNQIRRNLWGITLQGEAEANFGDDAENLGDNVFADNENNGEVYALYNNTPNDLTALHNCWVEEGDGTLAEAEAVIFHFVDDPTLGEVSFDPINCHTVGLPGFADTHPVIYPNPTRNQLTVVNTDFEQAVFYDINGRKVFESSLLSGENQLIFSLKSGIYFVSFEKNGKAVVEKLVVE